MPPSSNNLTLHTSKSERKKNNTIMQIIQIDELDDFPSAVVLACKLQLHGCTAPVASRHRLPASPHPLHLSRFACRCARLALGVSLLIRRNCHTS
jgi:hypothetical protein